MRFGRRDLGDLVLKVLGGRRVKQNRGGYAGFHKRKGKMDYLSPEALQVEQ